MCFYGALIPKLNCSISTVLWHDWLFLSYLSPVIQDTRDYYTDHWHLWRAAGNRESTNVVGRDGLSLLASSWFLSFFKKHLIHRCWPHLPFLHLPWCSLTVPHHASSLQWQASLASFWSMRCQMRISLYIPVSIWS